MFPGYDPDRHRPYAQDVYSEINGKTYVTTYYVCNGYGGSIRISSGPARLVSEDENEEISDRQQ